MKFPNCLHVIKGVTIIGGCCRVFASDISQLSESIKAKHVGQKRLPNPA